MALELAAHNIQVNSLVVGAIATDMTPVDRQEKFLTAVPAGRVGTVEEIARLVTFVVSDGCDYLTGASIRVDGGLTLGFSQPARSVREKKPMEFRLTGLVAATFTPMHSDGSLNLGFVPSIVDYLVDHKISALYVCGSTGEGPSLSTEERETTAAAYVSAVAGRIPVLVQVGHASLTEARRLAAHAKQIGAAAISATSPYYFKPDSVEVLVSCLAEITEAAPEMPFYYYHIPRLTGIELNMLDLLRIASTRLPTLVGIKYSGPKFDEYLQCIEFDGGRFDVPFGCDDMLLSGLTAGARAAVGSTYNFLAPVNYRMIDAFGRGDVSEAAAAKR